MIRALFGICVILSSFLLAPCALSYEESEVWSSGMILSRNPELSSIPITDVIQIGDKLNIKVFREQDLSGFFYQRDVGFTVDFLGFIEYPLLGQVRAQGLTLVQFQMVVEEALRKDYLVDPQVHVEFYRRSVGSKVAIVGQVQSPNSYDYDPNMTITRLISLARGFRQINDQRRGVVQLANSKEVRVTRIFDDKSKVSYLIDVDEIVAGKAEDFNLEIGDLIFVPKRKLDMQISILGEVKRQGNFDYSPGMSVVRAIGQADGFTSIAAPNRIRLTRMTEDPNKRDMFTINVEKIMNGQSNDVLLYPGDIIYVPESFI